MNAVVKTLELPLKVSRETLDAWAEKLEHAATLRAGAMDSESRHLEVARSIQVIISTLALEMRSL